MDIKGFIKYRREVHKNIKPKERVLNFNEFTRKLDDKNLEKQAERCMNCGVPFCHSGCPVDNMIPDFNKAVSNEKWDKAYSILSETNNFPEFTGRLCPAPCESSCVLSINRDAVSIKSIEYSIIEKAFEMGWVRPRFPVTDSGKKIAIVGSGPAGLAAADELAYLGHHVTVYEKNDKIGGLLRYGIPDFKMEKKIIDRRLDLMREAGISFKTNLHIGKDITIAELHNQFDAFLLCCGASVERDIDIPGRHLHGIHFAMTFLEQANKFVNSSPEMKNKSIDVNGKTVVVIGGGDTGADCVGTANRMGAQKVIQIELLGKPPQERDPNTPWPMTPNILRTSTSHEEGCDRRWALNSKEFIGDENGHLKGIRVLDLEWQKNNGTERTTLNEMIESDKIIPCDVVLIAIGFKHAERGDVLSNLQVELDNYGNVKTQDYLTSKDKIYAAGDMHTGQSLIVNAIAEGRKAAARIHFDLIGEPGVSVGKSKYSL